MPVLTATLRVKNEAHNLPRCLANLERFCDHIVAYDDGSTDDTVEILKAHPKVRHVVSFEKGFYHETMDRSISLALATLTNPDWIFRIDPDEELEDRGIELIPKLMEMDDYKAWAFKRINFVGGEEEGDLEYAHWCLYRYVPGKVFFYNIKFHRAFPCVDKVPGKWGLANLRVKHFGYVDKSAKQEMAKKNGYYFGDYLTPYFQWEEKPDSPFLIQEMLRPGYFPNSQQHADAMQVGEGAGHNRYPEMEKIDLYLTIAWEALTGLATIEAGQAIENAKALIGDNPKSTQKIRLQQAEALHAMLCRQWDKAEALFSATKNSCLETWPYQAFIADEYLMRIADMKEAGLVEPYDPGILNYEGIRQKYLDWFFDQISARDPKDVYIFGAGRHTLILDDMGLFHRLNVKGIVDDKPKNRAVNKLPVLSPEEAKKAGAKVLLISTDQYEPQLIERFQKEDLGSMEIQPIYWSLDDRKFWFDAR